MKIECNLPVIRTVCLGDTQNHVVFLLDRETPKGMVMIAAGE